MDLPNILLIVVDAGRGDRFSCMSHLRETTPGIDQLARQGTVFRQAISTATWTVPAHGSLFTGQFSSKHRAHNQSPMLSPKIRTLAEVLNDQGYACGSFCNNPYAGSPAGFDRGFDYMLELWKKKERRKADRLARNLARRLTRTEDSGCAEIMKDILSFTSGVEAEKPWFAFANLVETHLPFRAPAKWQYKFLPTRLQVPSMDALELDPIRFHLGELQYSDEDLRLLSARYDGQLAYIDHMVSSTITLLRTPKRPLLTIITADHGENLGEHGLISHEHCIYDSLLHIPWIMNYPGVIPHEEVNEQVQLLDLPVTLLGLLGVDDEPFLREAQGINALDKSARLARPFAFAEHHRPRPEVLENRYRRFPREMVDRGYRAIREEGAKFIWQSNGQHEFYDLYRDPMEKQNIYSEETARAEGYAARLQQWLEDCEKQAERIHGVFTPSVEAVDKQEDEAVLERLRELGYIE